LESYSQKEKEEATHGACIFKIPKIVNAEKQHGRYKGKEI
jgi:hypothetical protein